MDALIDLVLLAATFGQQQPPAPPPAAAPVAPAPAPVVAPLPKGEQQTLQALVIAVEGRAEWKAAGADAKFKEAALNDLLDPGCEIRTGLRSSVTLRVGKNATLVVDRSSRIELPVIVQDGAVLRTRASVWRGKCDFKVEAVGVTSDFQVLTPSATLAVRGTGFSVQWGALEGLEVRGVDTNRVRAIEVSWLATLEQVFVSGGGETGSGIHDPARRALFRTVFPPPSPGQLVGDFAPDPNRPPFPPPLRHILKNQQQIDHGGSDLGQDINTGAGKPGIPPTHQ